MEAAALAGLEWVVAPVIKDLVREIISYLKSDIALDLAYLETILLPQIQLIIEAAQRMPPESLPAGWLKKLEDDYKDAKLFVDGRSFFKSIIKKFIRKPSSLLSPQMYKKSLLQRLNEFEHRVEEAEIFLRTHKTESKDAIIAGKSPSVTSSLVNHLLKKSVSYLGTKITKDLEDLETTLLPQVRLTIQAAQRIPPDDIPPLTRWLARLMDAYDDAEAILHEVECNVKGEAPRSSTTDFVKPSLLAQNIELLQRLNNLKKVAAESETFLDLLSIQKNGSKSAIIQGKRSSVTSWLLPDKVFGRDRDRDDIINFMSGEIENYWPRDKPKGYSVVAVTGMEGAGKTTLAQYVYNNRDVQRYFDMRMWICLSQNLDIIMHTREMVECATEEVCPNLRNLGNLQTKLRETLTRFNNILIVLDDVWYDNNDRAAREKQWENFLKPFYYIRGTCIIVVTSRSTSFPFALLPKKHIELSDLAPDDLISLLRDSAIDGLQIRNSQSKNNFSDLSDVVDQIAHEMYQLPFANTIIKFLLDEQGLDKQGDSSWRSYSSYPVVGITGAGKTTLAKYVYNHPMVKKHFGLRMWLPISKKLDVIKFTKKMIECASHQESPNLDNLFTLQEKLEKTLPESDILVVLDDACDDKNDRTAEEEKQWEWEWERFLKPFDYIKGTCKVVVTSRSTSFPPVLKPRKLIELSDSAIDGLQIKNSRLKSDSNDLCDIVDPIAQKMSKLPLAAKIIGNQLRERPDITFWQDTLEKVKLSIDGVIADISSVISSPLDKVFGHDGDRDEIINYATSPLLTDNDFGCDGDRDEIIKFLLDEQGDSSSRKSYSVVAVTGMEGAGKTTLAQYVYDDPRVKKFFGVRMWLCLSQNFDIKEATKEMIECGSGKECPNILDLGNLQNKLRETLPEVDNILVILDDVRYDNNDGIADIQWQILLAPFACRGSRGGTCKIVLTSRSKSFPFALPPGKLIELSNLAPDVFKFRG